MAASTGMGASVNSSGAMNAFIVGVANDRFMEEVGEGNSILAHTTMFVAWSGVGEVVVRGSHGRDCSSRDDVTEVEDGAWLCWMEWMWGWVLRPLLFVV